jgi:hypothetical protein
MKEPLSSSETSFLTRATRRNIPEDAILDKFMSTHVAHLVKNCEFDLTLRDGKFIYLCRVRIICVLSFNLKAIVQSLQNGMVYINWYIHSLVIKSIVACTGNNRDASHCYYSCMDALCVVLVGPSTRQSSLRFFPYTMIEFPSCRVGLHPHGVMSQCLPSILTAH